MAQAKLKPSKKPPNLGNTISYTPYLLGLAGLFSIGFILFIVKE